MLCALPTPRAYLWKWQFFDAWSAGQLYNSFLSFPNLFLTLTGTFLSYPNPKEEGGCKQMGLCALPTGHMKVTVFRCWIHRVVFGSAGQLCFGHVVVPRHVLWWVWVHSVSWLHFLISVSISWLNLLFTFSFVLIFFIFMFKSYILRCVFVLKSYILRCSEGIMITSDRSERSFY